MTISRDDAIWFYGKLVSVAGLVVTGAFDPAMLGISANSAAYVKGACTVILAVSAQMSTSSLPGKEVK